MADDSIPADFDVELPWRRKPSELAEQLGGWATQAIAPDAKVLNVVAPENGMSSESVLFDVEHEGTTDQMVARLAPLPSLVPVFERYDIELQAKVMRLVGERTTVPVPEVPFVELDESFLQVPFLVMKRSRGTAPTDIPPYVFGGWVADLSADERDLMQRNAVEVLVKLHELTPANADLASDADAVVVLAPIARGLSRAGSPEAQVRRLSRRSTLVTPDKDALRDFGRNVLDPAKRADAARAGLRQSAEVVEQVRSVWP